MISKSKGGQVLYAFLKNLFGFGDTKNRDRQETVPVRAYQNHDAMDYDGMGNQGRFPPVKKNKK